MFSGGGTPWAWRKVRADVLDRDGYRCRLRHSGCLGEATEVHHLDSVKAQRISRQHADALDPDRCIAVCTPCHRRETQRQSAQARWGNRKRRNPIHPVDCMMGRP